MSAARPSYPHGFTLVELLVALTIFVTVMASVALVFNGAIRTSKQGFLNQEAFELARGTMKVLERDISRAFTGRDHGDVFNFYGTPIGFTYVGLISADESSAPNMARVTYVMYHDLASTLAGSVGQYESKDGGTVPTYNLLRYIEPGHDTLDSFPIDWNAYIDSDVNGLPASPEAIVNGTVALAGCPDAACEGLVRQSARRELWIKMLSGGGETMQVDVNNDGLIDDTVRVPSAWDDPQIYLGIPAANPVDYVVGENIRNLQAVNETCAATTVLLEPLIPSGTFFESIYQNAASDYCTVVLSDANEPPYFEWDTPATFSITADFRPFFTYWDIGVITNDDPADPADSESTLNDQHTPVAFRFWNDQRNMISDGLDNDGDNWTNSRDLLDNDNDGTIDEPNEGVDEADERYAQSAGSPLDTRLPIAVTTDFTLFFRSPYPGAPDFNERFTQRIDLPTATRRTITNSVPVTP